MRRHSIIAAVALFATLLAASLALAAKSHSAKRHSVTIALKETAIYVTPGPGPGPGPPSFAREAGLFTGSLGSGVNSTDVHVRAGTGTREFFTHQGSIHGSLVFTGASTPSGDTIIGTVTITGGTGKYAHVHGKLHINGFHSNTTHYSTEQDSGTLTY